jgi:hypothetical protein
MTSAESVADIVSVDIWENHSQYDGVSRQARVFLIVITVALLPWLGMLQALPHDHGDARVPSETLACSASHPTSSESHLHTAGVLLAPHQCLACLAGASHAESPPPVKLVGLETSATLDVERPADVRSRSCAALPLLRGPPDAA